MAKGIPSKSIDLLQPIINLKGTNEEKIADLKKVLASSEIGLNGISELETIFDYLKTINIHSEIEIDLTLARGLNYYTGAIFEVVSKDVAIGSICGGGRYDDLTSIFGLKDVSGVGISFGADRIYDVLNQLNIYPENRKTSTEILFVNFGEKESKFCLPIIGELRDSGINTEIFPDKAKMKKQLNYANKKNIPYVAMVGDNEMKENYITLKNMEDGVQNKYSVSELIKIINH